MNPEILTKILSTQLLISHAKAQATRSIDCPIQLLTVANDTIDLLKQLGISYNDANLPRGFDPLLQAITTTLDLNSPIQKPSKLPDTVTERWTTLLRNSTIFNYRFIPPYL